MSGWNWRFHDIFGIRQIIISYSIVSDNLGAPYWPGYDESAETQREYFERCKHEWVKPRE